MNDMKKNMVIYGIRNKMISNHKVRDGEQTMRHGAENKVVSRDKIVGIELKA